MAYVCAPHISQTPCSGCHGMRFSWQTVGGSDVYNFCTETMKNAREIPCSLLLPAIQMAKVCVDTMHPQIEAACAV